MPLRSVEAATRDDAIAAAREQFGASARVVGVRRVRSGGVLGFFATERYVAQVDPDQPARPAVPVPAPARPSPTAGSRALSPVGGDASPWPGAGAASPDDDHLDDRLDELVGLLGSGAGAPSPVPASTPYPRPAGRADDVRRKPVRNVVTTRETPRVTASEPEPARPAVVRAATARPAWSSIATDAADHEPAAAPQPPGSAATPSPFTAALARMVSGDPEVRQAVEEALAEPAEVRAPAAAGPWPTWSGPVRTTETSVWSPAAHQEEEPVALQDYTPSSAPELGDPPAAVPTWAHAPEAAPQPSSDREEAIAEVLRSALAQDRSDEALAGILREVMDGASPQAALAEPTQPSMDERPVTGEPVPERPGAEPTVADPTVVVEPPMAEQPVAEQPVAEQPVAEQPVAEPPVAEPPVAETSASPLFGGSDLGWDDHPSSALWAEPSAPAPCGVPAVARGVVPAPAEPVTEKMVTQEPVTGPESVGAWIEVVDEQADGAVEQVGHGSDEVTESERQPDVSGQHFLLARTASDPAPSALDTTTVMPPLSLLPPLPSSRQRGGRPPVPPALGRAGAAPVRTPEAPAEQPSAPAAAEHPEALATVTRLPLATAEGAPVVDATPSVVESQPAAASIPQTRPPSAQPPSAPVVAAAGAVPIPAERPARDTSQDTAVITPATIATPSSVRAAARAAARAAVATPPVRAEDRSARAAAPARPRSVVPASAVPADADVVSRLIALGVPAELLGGSFADDAATHGTYAALTRALTTALPGVPQMPVGAGEVLVVVGPGVETLRTARALAASMRLDPDRVQWASRGDLAALAPASGRMATIETAIDRRQEAAGSGTVTIVAVDAPLRTDAYWTAQMLAIWTPVAVWALVEATRKPEDLEPWLEGLPRVDALMVSDSDLSADPAAILRSVALPQELPVATLDGVLATPHRWASLLCERLEAPQT